MEGMIVYVDHGSGSDADVDDVSRGLVFVREELNIDSCSASPDFSPLAGTKNTLASTLSPLHASNSRILTRTFQSHIHTCVSSLLALRHNVEV